MTKGMGINIGIGVNQTVSDKNIKDYLDRVGKSKFAEFSFGINKDEMEKRLRELAKSAEGALSFDIKFNENGTIDILKTIMNEHGQILKIREQMDEQGERHLKQQILIKDNVKQQEEAFKNLLNLTKQKGKLEKELATADSFKQESLRKQREEIDKQIQKQERYIKSNNIENEQLRKKVDLQKEIDSLSMKDDKQSKAYDKLINSIKEEFNIKKQMVGASKEEVEVLKQKLEVEQRNKKNASAQLSRNGGALRTDEMEKIVTQTKALGQAELDIVKKREQQEQAFTNLVSLTKEKGKLDKDSITRSGEELEAIKQRSAELDKQIATQEKLIKKNDLDDEKMRAKVTSQILKDEIEINRAKAKSSDNERAKGYDSIIKSIEKEYKYRNLLVNATDIEVDSLKEKIDLELENQTNVRNSLKEKKLESGELEKTVQMLTQQQQKELALTEAKKTQTQQVKLQKDLYADVFRLENELTKLTQKGMNASGEKEQGLSYTLIQEKSIELERKMQEIKNLGLVSEEKENQLLTVRKTNQEQILLLENKLLDSQNAQLVSKEKFLELERMRMSTSIKDVMSDKNEGFYDIGKVEEFTKRMKDLDKLDLKNARHEVSKLKLEIRDFANDTNNKRIKATSETIEEMKYSFSDLTKYVTGAMVIRQFWNMLRQGAQDVLALNSAVTTLKITMEDLSDNQISSLTKSSQEMAKELKASVNDVLLSVKTVANANETIDTILAKSKPAVILSNLTGLDTSVTVDAIQGATKAFDDLAEATEEDAMRVADAMVSISKSLGMDFAEGIQGMTNSLSTLGSFANQVGMSLEDTLGTISGIAEATRLSFDEVATAMRNIIARTMRIADVDNGIDEAEMLKAEKALKSIGVAIRGTDGNMREFMDILKDIAGGWDTLNKQQQQYVADSLGGAQRVSQVIAMINEFERSQELVAIAVDSSGSAMKAQGVWAEGLEAKLKELTTSSQLFWQTFLSSESFGMAIESLTELINLGTDIVDTFGSLPTTITALTLVLSVGSTGFRNFTSSLSASALGMVGFNAKAKLAQLGVQGVTISMKAAEIQAYALQIALSMGLSLAVTAVIGKLVEWASNLKTTDELMQDANDSARELNQTLQETSVTKTNFEEYRKLKEELDGVNLSLEERNEKEQQVIDLRATLSQDEEFAKVLSNENLELEQQAKWIDYIIAKRNEEKLDDLETSVSKTQSPTDILSEISTAEYDYNNSLAKKIELEDKYNEKLAIRLDLIEGGYDTTVIDNELENLKLQIDDCADGADNAKNRFMELSLALTDANANVQTLHDNGRMLDVATGELTNSQKELQSTFLDGGEAIDDYNKYLEEKEERLKRAGQEAKELSKNLSSLNSLLKDDMSAEQNFVSLGKELEDIQSIIDKINENGLTYDTMDKVLSTYDDFKGVITDVADVQDFLNQKFSDMEDAQAIAYHEMYANSTEYFNANIRDTDEWLNYQAKVHSTMVDFENEMLSLMSDANDTYYQGIAEKMEEELKNASSLAEGRLAIQGSLLEEMAKLELQFAEATMYEYDTPEARAINDRIQKIREVVGTFKDIEKDFLSSVKIPTFNGSGSFMGSSSSSSASKETEKLIEDLENLANVYYEVENAITDVSNALKKNQLLQEYATPQDKIRLLEEEARLLKEQAKSYEDMMKAQQGQANAMQGILKENGFTFDDKGDITNYQQRIKSLTDWANSLKGKEKEEAIDFVEDLIKSVDTYIDLVNNDLPSTEQSWLEALNAIKKHEREQLEYVTDVQKQITSAIEHELKKRTEAVKTELQKQKDLYNKKFEEEDYEDSLNKEQRKLEQIQQQINDLSRDTSVAGQLRLQQLMAEYEAQREVIDQMIRDKEKENGNNAFDEAMDNLDKELDEALQPENLAKLMNDALATGIIQIGDEFIKLDDIMSTWLDETGDGLYALGNTLRSELIHSLEVANSLLVELGTGFKSLSDINTTVDSRAIGGSRSSQPQVEFNAPLLSIGNVEGDLADSFKQQLNIQLERMKDELTNAFARQLQYS